MKSIPCLLALTCLLTPALHASTQEFRDYWQSGKAELSTYSLEQARYGAIHSNGEVTLIFVTEDLLEKRQVKSDYDTAEPAIPVLKLNAMRRFNTGIYTYSLMSSVFTPLDFAARPRTLKVTTSIQDWCGQTWTQINLTPENQYRIELRSYFQVEGDRESTIPAVWLEEEIWTRLRLDPRSLPQGETQVVPARIYTRFYKKPETALPAVGSLRTVTGSEYSESPHSLYELRYNGQAQRTLRIWFDTEFPHTILAWTETGAGSDAGMVTRARRIALTKSDYWSHNAPSDLPLRDELKLPR